MKGTHLGVHIINRCWGILQKCSSVESEMPEQRPVASSMVGDRAVKDTMQVPTQVGMLVRDRKMIRNHEFWDRHKFYSGGNNDLLEVWVELTDVRK